MVPSNPVSVVGDHPDLALAERCRHGDPKAFEELYRLHAPRLFGLAHRLVGPNEAEDLLQEIFLSAHRKMPLYKGESSLGTWLFRLATNQCLDYLRSKRARLALLTDAFDEADGTSVPTAAGAILGVVERMDLERALAELPGGARAVFVLHDVEGYKHREIGKLVGITTGTSKGQLHRARAMLRRLLGRSDRMGSGHST